MEQELTQADLDAIHDCLLNAIGKFDLSNEEILAYWNMLPEDIKADVIYYGASDTPTREDMFTWFKNNCQQE